MVLEEPSEEKLKEALWVGEQYLKQLRRKNKHFLPSFFEPGTNVMG